MIRAVLNCLSCGSENRRNRRVSNFVHVCLLLVLILFLRLCGSKLASVWLLIAFCVDLATSSCGQLVVFKISVLGGYFLHFFFDVSCLFQAVRSKKLRMGRCCVIPMS